MRLYAIKMHNFMRFGESNNTIVFDITEKQKQDLSDKKITFDSLYEKIGEDPLDYTETVKKYDKNVLEGIVGIAGMTGGSFSSSNGSGKSTIFEAISYLFYDRVVRQTANTDKKGSAGLSVVTKLNGEYPKSLTESFVECYFEENSRVYRLKRGRSFTKTKKSSSPIFEFDCIKDDEIDSLSSHRKKDTKKSLEEVIVEDYDIFVNTVMFGQNDAGKFLVGTDKIKKDMIIELLKLEDVVHGCIDVIRSHKKAENKKKDDVESRLSSRKNQVLSSLRKYEEEHEHYDDSLIDALINKIEFLKSERQSLRDENSEKIKSLTSQIEKLRNSSAIKLLNEYKEKLENLNLEKAKFDAEEKESLRKKEKAVSEIESKASILTSKKDDNLLRKNSEEAELNAVMKDVNIFSQVEYDKFYEKYEKAVAIRPSLEEQKLEVMKKIEKASSMRVESEVLVKMNENIISKLSAQLDKDTFVCSECQSTVSKEHLQNKIASLTSEVEQEKVKLEKISVGTEKLLEKKESISNKLFIIDKDYIHENDLKLELKKRSERDKERIPKIREKIEFFDKEIKGIEAELANLRIQYKNAVDEHKKFEHDIASKNAANLRAIKSAEDDLNRHKSLSDKVNKDIESKSSKKAQIADEVRKLDQSIGSLSKEVENALAISSIISKEEQELTEVNKQLQRWVILEKAFGLEGVQTRIVAKYLPLLNMHIKKYLDILSDGKLIVKLVVNKKSKVDMEVSGGTADNYVMLSGGEKMIVRLAVDVGLSLLSFSRTARTPDMICLDEIFGPLDSDHTKRVFLMLDELKSNFKRVFLISHKSEIQSMVENNILINKVSGNNGLSQISSIGEIPV